MLILKKAGLVFTAAVVLALASPSLGQIRVSIRIGPPPLPVYEQPLCPAPNYLWTPGYWAYDYDDQDYYWVPGTWVLAPQVGYLWTPGYWAWMGDGFAFHEGFWGPAVGFYGGINYGYGYFGNGYEGGRWDRGQFYYNRSINNVNVTEIHNVYNTTVINNTVNRVSYNGGTGGINARPTPHEQAAERERHLPPVQTQVQHAQLARREPEQRASVNHGKPAIAASPRPEELRGAGVVPAREAGGAYNSTARSAERGNTAANQSGAAQPPETAARREGNKPVHARDIQPWKPDAPANGASAMMDQKYQQKQHKLAAQQEKQREKLQAQQDRDHQQWAQAKADEARKQQQEQSHQQQTERLQAQQNQKRQKLEQKYEPARSQPGKNEAPRNEPPHSH
jgi:hypothetical protein